MASCRIITRVRVVQTASWRLLNRRGLLCLPSTEEELNKPSDKVISLFSEVDSASRAFDIMSKHFPKAWGFGYGLEENSLSAAITNCNEGQREVIYKQLANRDCTELEKIGDKSCIRPGLITVGGEKGKRIISEAYECVGLPPHMSFKSDLAFLDRKGKVPMSWLVRKAPAAFNIHPAPPEKRGAGVYVPSLIAGESRYGCTAHVMTPALDAGPIIAVKRFPIPKGSTRTSLRTLATNICFETLEEVLIRLKFTDPMADVKTTCHYTWGGGEYTLRMMRRMLKEAENKYGPNGHPALV